MKVSSQGSSAREQLVDKTLVSGPEKSLAIKWVQVFALVLVFVGVALAKDMPKESARLEETKMPDVDMSVGGIPVKVVVDMLRESRPSDLPKDIRLELNKKEISLDKMARLMKRDVDSQWFASVRNRIHSKRGLVIGLQNMQTLSEIQGDIRIIKDAYLTMSAKIDSLSSLVNDFMMALASGGEPEEGAR